MSRPTTWGVELSKEAPPEYIQNLLRNLYPGVRLEDIRHLHQSGIDWRMTAQIDDKNDTWLGKTENISLDQNTLGKKDTYQLFVNYPMKPGYYILIDNAKLDPVKILFKIKKVAKATTDDQFTTRSFIVRIKDIKDAVVSCFPPLTWWIEKAGKEEYRQ
jgi:hypothetical protein